METSRENEQKSIKKPLLTRWANFLFKKPTSIRMNNEVTPPTPSELAVPSESPIMPLPETETKETQLITPHIANILVEKLQGKNITPPEFKSIGVAAFGGTNEAAPKSFFEAVQAKNPDGYLIGIGAGNVLTMLHCFPDSVVPKGVVLADIDPKVVTAGKLMVKKLNQSETAEDFDKQFVRLSKDQFFTEISSLIEQEDNTVLKQRLSLIPKEEWDLFWGNNAGAYESYRAGWKPYEHQGSPLNVSSGIRNKFPVLKQLAETNNIAVFFADFTNPALIEPITQLPDFRDSTNIIYLSNIADHISHRGSQIENLSSMQSLTAYQKASKSTIFIDSLQTLLYYLRARHSLPQYSPSDLSYNTYMANEIEAKSGWVPPDLIFADRP